MNNAYDRLQNEGGDGYVDYDTRYPKEPSKAEQEAILAKAAEDLLVEFCATWTADVTAARKAAWNAETAKAGFDPRIAQRVLGFAFSDLKRAAAMYK